MTDTMTFQLYNTDWIYSYSKVQNLLQTFMKSDSYHTKIKKEVIGFTTFQFPIECYTIGHGKKHILILGATHGCEIVTTDFVLDTMQSLLEDNVLYQTFNDYSFHFIPILNPEGYIISTSNILPSTHLLKEKELEDIATHYQINYTLDDELASKHIQYEKMYQKVLSTSLHHIPYSMLKESVRIILKNCGLSSSILPVWAANGIGVDLNSNSIHEFENMVALRKKQKYATLRYNDIPVTKPSPMSYPGKKSLGRDCPENVCLYRYIRSLYENTEIKDKSKEKLVAIFSYHATGGEIYGFPNKDLATTSQILLHQKGMQSYQYYTNYSLIDETLKYGVMDYYRIYLNQVLTLTIELSKGQGNPIGPFSNLSSLKEEFIHNKKALFYTIEQLSK